MLVAYAEPTLDFTGGQITVAGFYHFVLTCHLMRRFLLIFMALGLASVLGVSLTFTFLVPDSEPTLDRTLAELLPSQLEGWHSQDMPLSSTPDGEERVLDILKLDDYFAREYIRGDTRVMVYVAYWLPKSQPYSMVGLHNPDSCWVIAGWDIKERENARQATLAGCALKSHEWGVYQKAGEDTYVMFWHLLGGEPNEYIKHMTWTQAGVDSIKRQFYFIYNILQMGLDLGRDQLFVRISSNKPFDELQHDPHFKHLLESFRVLGIEEAALAAAAD